MKVVQNYSLITKIGGIAISLALPFAITESAQAIIFVENLSVPTGSAFIINNVVPNYGPRFTTDGNNYSLNSVTARLREDSEDNFSISLYTDNGGQPGTVIEELNTAADILPSVVDDYLFTSSNSVNLDANTTYWLIGSTGASGQYAWGVALPDNQTGTWTIDDGAFSTNGGSSWTIDGTSWAQFSVDADVGATPVPFGVIPDTGLGILAGIWGVSHLRKTIVARKSFGKINNK